MNRPLRPLTLVVAVTALLLAGCGDDDDDEGAQTTTSRPALTTEAPAAGEGVPPGPQLSAADLAGLVALFDDQPYAGGQTAPRVSKWISPNSYIFLQFDKFPPDQATEVTYAGVAVKGVFCAEAQPDAQGKSFTHLHRPNVPDYSQGHGGPPSTQGYWLSWMALDSFTSRDGRAVVPGIDYQFSHLDSRGAVWPPSRQG